MSGEIKHEWTGSVLTITSDAGTSSVDLKGQKGDTGPRGPQGPAGLLLDEKGNVVVDLSPYDTSAEVDAKIERAVGNVDLSRYATKAYVIEAVENNEPDLSDYATKNYVATEIAQAQLSGGGGSGDVDLSGYATKDDLNNYATKAELDNYVTPEELVKVSIAIDNKTIKQAGDGSLCTAIGGAEYVAGDLIFTSEAKDWVLDSPNTGGMTTNGADYRIGNSTYDFQQGTKYLVVIDYADGTQSQEWYSSSTHSTGDYLEYVTGAQDSRIWVQHLTNGNVYFWQKYGGFTKDKFIRLSIYNGAIETIVETIKPQFIPVDGTTITVNAEGKLTSMAGSVSFDNYYTKSEIDALLASIETYPSAEEVLY